LPGDKITIPPIAPKAEPGETEMLHRFVRLGEPTMLRLQILDDDEPVANQPWELQVDGKTYTGTTDPQGKLEACIPGGARKATLVVGTETDEQSQYVYDLDLGDIDPVESIRGVQLRLRNLGFLCPDSGELDDETRQAILAFQKRNELPENGRPDDKTRQALKDKHGC
jgi:peptidoglycan hydrolase-like protein with peptidoglycan-binding domain